MNDKQGEMPTIRCGDIVTEICGSVLLAQKEKGRRMAPS
jgi:hypothetical protein